MSTQAFIEAVERHNSEVIKAYMYEDWILGIRRDGKILKLPVTTIVRPFPVVKAGKLPHADKIESGYVIW